MKTLKFITAGNVDDGKSTLIGRLLYDSGSIHTDQLDVLEKQTKMAGTKVDLSLVTDGLRAEREQGITIDVAYKYFATAHRKFIIADAPGHEQYTRNMITGASNSDLVVLLVDARKGITTQTRRHASIASLMGIRKAIVAVNKIDLVGYSEQVFRKIESEFNEIRNQLKFNEIRYIPVSALEGDNVVEQSENMPWYKGKSLLQSLEHTVLDTGEKSSPRFQVQWIIRPKDEEHHEYRGYAGQILSGSYEVGNVVKILPSGTITTITEIERNLKKTEHAVAGENVVFHFRDKVDISRGDAVVKIGQEPKSSNSIKSWICWLDEQNLQLGKTYLLQHRFRTVRVRIQAVDKIWDIHQYRFKTSDQIRLNDSAQVTLKTGQPLFYDAFEDNARTGNAILIDESTGDTLAALMFLNQEDNEKENL